MPRDDLIRIAEDSARGGFFLVVGALSATFVSAVTAILVARFLGPELYGQYTLSLVITEMLFMFANLGVSEGIIKYASAFQENGRTRRATTLIKHAMLLKALTGLVFFLLNFVSADLLAATLFQRPELGVYIRLASISLLFQVIYTTTISAYLGLNKMQYRALTLNIQVLTKAVVAIALVLLGFSVTGAVLGNVAGFVAGSVIGSSILLLIFRKNIQRQENSPSFIQNTKILLRYGSPIYLSQILVSFVPSYQNLILGIFSTDVAVGNLKAAHNFITFITVVTGPIATVLFPAFSKLNSQKRINGETKTFFKFANKYTTLVILPIPTFFILFSKEIIGLTYGSTYGDAAFFLSIYCFLYFLVGIGYRTLTSLFNGLGRTRITLKRTLISFFGVLILTPVFVKAFGVPGVILAFISAQTASTGYGMYVAKRSFHIEFDAKSLTKIYLIAGFSAIPLLLALQVLALSGLLRLLVGGAIYLLVYVTLAPLTGVVSMAELETAARIVRRIKPLAPIIKPLIGYLQRILKLRKGTTNNPKTSF